MNSAHFSPLPETTVPETPSAVRYRMIALTTLVAVMLYLDRVCLSIVGEQLRPNLGIDETEFAWLMSSFFWAYALFQLPAGWLGDRFGPRRMLTIYLFFWSACTGLMGLATGFFTPGYLSRKLWRMPL